MSSSPLDYYLNYEYEYHYPSEDYYEYLVTPDIYENVYTYSGDFNMALQILTIIVNFCHLWILIQKEVRQNSIYILMIGICISDTLHFSISVYLEVCLQRRWFIPIFDLSHIDCLREDFEVIHIGLEIFKMILNSTRPISVWLAIIMAMIRTLSLIFPLKTWTEQNTKEAGLQILAIATFWGFYYSWNFLFIKNFWYPDNLCAKLNLQAESVNITQYVYAVPSYIYRTMDTRESWEPWVKIVPTLFYPVLSIRLVFKLREIKKLGAGIYGTSPDSNLTKLILLMTISFMLSEGLDGVRSFVLLDFYEWKDNYYHTTRTLYSSQYIITSLRCLNAMSHAFICYAMSSHYRNTVNRIIFVGKPKMKVIPVRSSNFNSSRSSSGQVFDKCKPNMFNY